MKNISRRYIGGFTLIELLVVVLIIGILSAVAVPMYEKVIWRARSQNLQILVKALADAQERYFLANGEYATDMDNLDISFDSLEKKKNTKMLMIYPLYATSSTVYGNDLFEIGILTYGDGVVVYSGGWFVKGPYRLSWRGTGFNYPHKDYRLKSLPLKKMYCSEGEDVEYFGAKKGDFCGKVMKGTFLQYFSNNDFYELP